MKWIVVQVIDGRQNQVWGPFDTAQAAAEWAVPNFAIAKGDGKSMLPVGPSVFVIQPLWEP